MPVRAEKSAPLLIIGVDGFSWNVISSMTARGGLPNLKALIDTGVSARLQSLPARTSKSNSAVIWTSVATGKTPEKHGIQGFVKQDRLYTREDRRVKAFWNILSERRRKVGVVGWWVTWPAEPVSGVMVAYNFWPARFSRDSDCRGCPIGSNRELPFPLPGSIYPEVLAAKYAPLIVTERDLVERDAWAVHEGPDGTNFEYWAYARDLSMFRVAREVLRENSPEVFAVYFESPDIVSHKSWMLWTGEDFYHPGIGSWTKASEADRHQVGGRLERYYSFIDRLIGDLRGATGTGWRTLVLSDHGFETYEDLRKLELAQKKKIWQMTEEEKKRHHVDTAAAFGHSPTGVFILHGGGIAAGKTFEGATIYDVAPTILHLAGEPAAKDMDGRVLAEAFTAGPAGRHPRFVKTYETVKTAVSPSAGRAPDEEALIERLKSLGYLSGGAPGESAPSEKVDVLP